MTFAPTTHDETTVYLDLDYKVTPTTLSILALQGAHTFDEGLHEDAADFYDVIRYLAHLLADAAFLNTYPDEDTVRQELTEKIHDEWSDRMDTLSSFNLLHHLKYDGTAASFTITE